jgi:hypothetical protein
VVGLELEHILLALIVAVAVYAVREIRRWRATVRPRRPDLTMEEAWQEWSGTISRHPDREFIPGGLNVEALPDHVRADCERNLALMAQQAEGADEAERMVIRRFILANATLATLLEAIGEQDENARQALVKGYQAGMDSLLRDAITSTTVKWIVLREYARGKFDDAVNGDWFHHYLHTARPYIREKVRLSRVHMLETDAGAGMFVAVYDTLLEELRKRVLRTRPKRRFVKPDLEQ